MDDPFAFDDDYVRRLRQHDARTEEHFYTYFQPRLFNRLRRHLRSIADVEEKRQETYKRVFKKLYDGDLRDGRTLAAFVLSVADNIVLEHYRVASRTEPLGDHHPEPVYEADAELNVISVENQRRVKEVLDELEPRDADILRAIFLDEVPREEVCRKFNVTPNYLRVLLHRALERFRAKYSQGDETKRD
jgi:RNA polymerase sigma-70 factor (ECF subfamily)